VAAFIVTVKHTHSEFHFLRLRLMQKIKINVDEHFKSLQTFLLLIFINKHLCK
jgi:hypothetical protein